MITVLVYCDNMQMYMSEFARRFSGKFTYYKRFNGFKWDHMTITFVTNEPRGYRVDIAIGFNQDGVDLFTRGSCINIKEKRTTTYFDLLDSINDDGSFNWEVYLRRHQWNLGLQW